MVKIKLYKAYRIFRQESRDRTQKLKYIKSELRMASQVLKQQSVEDEESINEIIIADGERSFAQLYLLIENKKPADKVSHLKEVFDFTDRRHIYLYMRLAWKSSRLHYKMSEE